MTRAVNTALAGSGGVLQVVQTVKTDTFSSNSASYVDITGLSVSITPTSTSSRILILATIQAVQATTTGSTLRLMRDATAISIADTAGSRRTGSFAELFTGRSDNFYSFSATYIDSPATTSTTTYKVQVLPNGYAAYINRSVSDVDNTGYSRGVSYLTVMEIAG